MELPSRELINAVMLFVPDAIELNKDGKSLDLYELAAEDGSVIGGGNINIYELMHMMKEWARDNDYRFDIKTYMLHRKVTVNIFKRTSSFSCVSINVEPTEFIAVTKACEWILKESK